MADTVEMDEEQDLSAEDDIVDDMAGGGGNGHRREGAHRVVPQDDLVREDQARDGGVEGGGDRCCDATRNGNATEVADLPLELRRKPADECSQIDERPVLADRRTTAEREECGHAGSDPALQRRQALAGLHGEDGIGGPEPATLLDPALHDQANDQPTERRRGERREDDDQRRRRVLNPRIGRHQQELIEPENGLDEADGEEGRRYAHDQPEQRNTDNAQSAATHPNDTRRRRYVRRRRLRCRCVLVEPNGHGREGSRIGRQGEPAQHRRLLTASRSDAAAMPTSLATRGARPAPEFRVAFGRRSDFLSPVPSWQQERAER